MIACRTFSFEGRSISLLWIRISYLSKVAVPSPHGDFRVVTFSFFVGSGTGPAIVIPDFLASSLMESQILLSISMSVLFSLTLTLLILERLEIGLKSCWFGIFWFCGWEMLNVLGFVVGKFLVWR